jgi:NADH-quinone oxidoreductase subunit J
LLLFQGAQFLAVATVVVYAGAILVTFLFVLMLANPQGRAVYDRVSWEAIVSAAAGAVIVGILSMTVTSVLGSPDRQTPPVVAANDADTQSILSDNQVVQLGEHLFGRHLVAVEVAGTLLLFALVGAAVIVDQARGPLAANDRSDAAPDAAAKEQGG